MGTGKQKNSNPLYYVIKEDIKKQISDKTYKPGDFISTEGELCDHYQVSRVTIRRAIDELVDEGVLVRERGKTAYVAKKAIPRSINRLSSLHEELTKAGIKVSSFILNTEVIESDESLAEKMGVGVGTPLYRIERLRYANGDPLCYQILYIVKELCPDLVVQELATNSLYQTLEKKYSLNIDYATQDIFSVLSTYKQTALLELPERACMLLVRRTTYLKNKSCVEHSESYYVGNKYNLSMTLQRESPR